MVHDHIWAEAGMRTDCGLSGMLCIGCLERRIGRTLTKADFTSAGVNDLANPLHTARLKDRLTTATSRQLARQATLW